MNTSNVMLLISSLFISLIFFMAVVVNLEVKREKEELNLIKKEIQTIRLEIKRAKIEIATLTSPYEIISYIENNNLKPVSSKNIKIIHIKNK